MAQLLQAVIDTQKNNYKSIGQVNAGDDLELELEVKMNGQSIEFINPECELLAKKSDNNRIRQTKDILYQGGKFKIKVDRQGITYPGVVTCQLLTKEDGRVSTCLFYFIVGTSLDREILQSIDKVEVLEQLDEYVLQAFENLREFEERIEAGDATIRKLNDDMIAAETNRENAEADRGSTFDNLVTRMNNVINVAITTDETLNNNETARINNFNTLKTELEQIREGLLNLNNSISLDEQNRVQAELDRANASIEAINRLNTTNTNITNAEASRVQEWNNIKSENTTLKEALTTINNTANSNEEVRKKKEEERIAAELQRQANFETMQQENNTFKGKIDAQYEEINTKVISVEERIQAIEENGVGGGNANIDDTTISKISTWSSKKIEDFVLTNDDVIWSTVQGENLSIEYTKEGYFREVEIWGNTWQDENNLEDIRHLGELYVDEEGQPILDSQGRKQYKIEIESKNNIVTTIFDNKTTSDNFTFTSASILDSGLLKLEHNSGATVSFNNPITLKPGAMIYVNIVQVNNTSGSSYSFRIKNEGTNLNNVYISEISNEIALKGSCKVTYTNNTSSDVTVTSIASYFGEYFISEILVFDNYDNYLNGYKYSKFSILLPCQLYKVGTVSDRLYWDNQKNKYIVQKNIADPSIFKNLSLTSNRYTTNGNDYYSIEFISPVPFTSGTVNILTTKLKYNKSIWGNVDFEGIRAINNTILTRVLAEKVTDAETFVNGMDIYLETTSPELIETNITEQLKIPCYINKTHLYATGGVDGIIKCKAPLDGGQAIQSLTTENYSIRNDVSRLSLENEELKEVNNTQDILIDTTMMATDEVYTMLEPILEMIPQTMSLERSVSKMVDMYVAMVQRGLKTIEQVPARYREEVREILAKLEK